MFSFSCDPTSLYHNEGVPGSGCLEGARAGRDGQREAAVSCLPKQDPFVPNAACVKVRARGRGEGPPRGNCFSAPWYLPALGPDGT